MESPIIGLKVSIRDSFNVQCATSDRDSQSEVEDKIGIKGHLCSTINMCINGNKAQFGFGVPIKDRTVRERTG